jgi:ABC-type antimicrobial peptide transport system permease subunit
VIRTSRRPVLLIPEVRRIVHSVDPEQPISNVQTMSDLVARQTRSRAVQVRVVGAFAVMAVLLAGIGIHGLLAFTVSQRRHEIGVRMALGAEPGVIVRGIVAHSARLALAGALPGVAIAYAGGRAMQSLLAGVSPGDAATFSVVAVLCWAMALAGSISPAYRAVRVPPAQVFRAD